MFENESDKAQVQHNPLLHYKPNLHVRRLRRTARRGTAAPRPARRFAMHCSPAPLLPAPPQISACDRVLGGTILLKTKANEVTCAFPRAARAG